MARALGNLLLLFVLAVGFAFGPAERARAQAADDPVVAVAAASGFEELARAIDRLALSGHPQALAIVEALRAGTLGHRVGDRALLWRDAEGRFRDAATGAVVEGVNPRDVRPIRINNRVRRSLDAALGALQLTSPDPRVRLAAAERVFRARDPDAIPALEAQLARETDPRIRRAMEWARAAAVLASDRDAAAKVEAVAKVRTRYDLEARGLLAGLRDQPPEVMNAAAAAIRAIDRHLALVHAAQDVVFGLSLGSVLLLAAIGLAITFGVMGVINMAHGEMVMLGAYTTFVVQDWIRGNAAHLFDLSLFIALPLAFLVAATAGVLIERGIIRFLYGRPLETLLATFGLSLILQQAVRVAFGPNNREVGNPSWMSRSVELFDLMLTRNRLWIIVFGFAVFFALLLVIQRTRFGLEMRAVTQNRRMAGSMGIRTPWIDSLTFALGSGVAGLAGVALSQIDNVSPNLGQGYIIDSFMVVVFGGVGNLWGTLVAAYTLGIVNKLLEPFAGAVLGKIAVLVLLVLFIQVKPRGLFPLKGRAVEA